LAMTYAGAAGNTKAELKKVLFGDWNENEDDVHTMYGEVMEILNKEGSPYKLELANRIYAHEPSVGDLLGSFKNILQQKYTSDIHPVDFGKSEETRGLINQWVEEKTNKKIKDLIASGVLSAMTRLVLVNAIYFKGDWKTQFDKEHTRSDKFHVSANKEIDVDMMTMRGQKLYYNENEEYQILGLPYKGEHLFMFVVLPRERFGLGELEKSLDGKKFLQSIMESNRERKLEYVQMPKFKLEETVELVKVLDHLGAKDMFSESAADFSNINGKKDLYVSDVIHKAFIEVNEEGTEATAATAAVMNLRCAMPMNPSFVADHPFLFTIIDMRSTSILFLGRYMGSK